MKSLKDYSLNITEQEYHDYPAWSHSLIASYAMDGFKAIATIHNKKEPTDSMRFGSLLDAILTKGKAVFDEYIVGDITCPPAERKVFDYLIKNGIRIPFGDIPVTTIEQAMNDCEFYMRNKPDVRLNKLITASEYYEITRTGKTVVSSSDWDDAMTMARKFRESPYLKTLFGIKNGNGIEYIYQAKYVVDYTLPSGRTIKYKVMPDLTVINHNDKTIQLVDLKTSAMPAFDFWENFLKYRYDIEAHSYSDVIEQIKNSDEKLRDYTILPYLFTDISRSDKQPVTWFYDQTSDEFADGFQFHVGEKVYKYKTWQKMLDEILDYEESQAVVPDGIETEAPNDIMAVINRD